MNPIKLHETERKKPLSYDVTSDKFLYINDIKQGRIVNPKDLSEEDQKKLTIRRLEIEDPFSIESLSALNKEQMINEIRKNSERGKELVLAEINYLEDTIEEIKKGELI